MSRLRSGTFLAPFHRAGENPARAIRRDLELVEHMTKKYADEVASQG